MSEKWIVGLDVVIVAALLVCIIGILLRAKGEGKTKYDERQIASRGIAFQAGFFTLLGCNVVVACMEAGGVTWLNDGLGNILALLVGIAVFAVVSICKDAFMGLNQAPCKWFMYFGLLMLINLLCAVSNLLTHKGGNAWLGMMNLAAAALMLVVIVAQGIHLFQLRKKQEEE